MSRSKTHIVPEAWKARVIAIMAFHQYSEREVGRRCGFGPTSVRAMLKPGNDVQFGTLIALSAGLECSIQWLLFGTGPSGVYDKEPREFDDSKVPEGM